MGKRRKFTNEFKLEAVKLAERGEVSVAQVASSGYYAWLCRTESPRQQANRALAIQIKAAH